MGNFLRKRKYRKRYKRFKTCSLPYPFYDVTRDTYEWVYFDSIRRSYSVDRSILYALGDFARVGVTYHYQANIYARKHRNERASYRIKINHVHNFEEVVQALYNHPDTFIIPHEYLKEYSEQELKYLKSIQNYLHIIDLRDEKRSKELNEVTNVLEELYYKKKRTIKEHFKLKKCDKLESKLLNKERLVRYNNSKAKRYLLFKNMYEENNNIIDSILKEERDYRIYRKFKNSSRIGKKYFLIDKEGNYRAILEFVSEEAIPFKDLTDDMVNYKISGFKSFKDYKQDLYYKFAEESKWYREDFNDNSKICYAKFVLQEIIVNNRTR